MADSYIQIPTDGSGKKVRTVSETVGAETVHVHFYHAQEPTGTRVDGKVTLTSASVAYAVPSSPPSQSYVLLVSHNQANSDEVRCMVTSATSAGHPICPGNTHSWRMPASTSLYFYCSSTAGQIMNYSTINYTS